MIGRYKGYVQPENLLHVHIAKCIRDIALDVKERAVITKRINKERRELACFMRRLEKEPK